MCRLAVLVEQPGYLYTVAQIREMVDEADVIVRAVAVDSARLEELESNRYPFQTYQFRIDFRTTEVLRGPLPDSVFTLPGSVVDLDDFNTLPVPYRMVRSSGQRGDCFSREYRIGGEYLFLLKRGLPADTSYAMTAWWMPLGPTNEPIHGADDPWVGWVRYQLSAP